MAEDLAVAHGPLLLGLSWLSVYRACGPVEYCSLPLPAICLHSCYESAIAVPGSALMKSCLR